MYGHRSETKPTVHADIISTLWPIENADGTVTPSWLKLRLDIRDVGGEEGRDEERQPC